MSQQRCTQCFGLLCEHEGPRSQGAQPSKRLLRSIYRQAGLTASLLRASFCSRGVVTQVLLIAQHADDLGRRCCIQQVVVSNPRYVGSIRVERGRGRRDELGNFLWLRDHRQMTRGQSESLGLHPLSRAALLVGCDHVVVRRNNKPTRTSVPRRLPDRSPQDRPLGCALRRIDQFFVRDGQVLPKMFENTFAA